MFHSEPATTHNSNSTSDSEYSRSEGHDSEWSGSEGHTFPEFTEGKSSAADAVYPRLPQRNTIQNDDFPFQPEGLQPSAPFEDEIKSDVDAHAFPGSSSSQVSEMFLDEDVMLFEKHKLKMLKFRKLDYDVYAYRNGQKQLIGQIISKKHGRDFFLIDLSGRLILSFKLKLRVFKPNYINVFDSDGVYIGHVSQKSGLRHVKHNLFLEEDATIPFGVVREERFASRYLLEDQYEKRRALLDINTQRRRLNFAVHFRNSADRVKLGAPKLSRRERKNDHGIPLASHLLESAELSWQQKSVVIATVVMADLRIQEGNNSHSTNGTNISITV
eukprot:512413_1